MTPDFDAIRNRAIKLAQDQAIPCGFCVLLALTKSDGATGRKPFN